MNIRLILFVFIVRYPKMWSHRNYFLQLSLFSVSAKRKMSISSWINRVTCNPLNCQSVLMLKLLNAQVKEYLCLAQLNIMLFNCCSLCLLSMANRRFMVPGWTRCFVNLDVAWKCQDNFWKKQNPINNIFNSYQWPNYLILLQTIRRWQCSYILVTFPPHWSE